MTLEPFTATPACRKCGSSDINTSYHRAGADYAAILSRLDDVDRRLSEIESSLGRSRDGKPGSNAHEQKETK